MRNYADAFFERPRTMQDELNSLREYRDKQYHEVFHREVKSVDEALDCLDQFYGKPKALQWICREAHNCPVHHCYHNSPHDFDDDCENEECEFRKIKIETCVRVNGPKHRAILNEKGNKEDQNRCESIWEE